MVSMYSRNHPHVAGKQGEPKCTMITISNYNTTVNRLVQTTVRRGGHGRIYVYIYAEDVLFKPTRRRKIWRTEMRGDNNI